METVFRILKRAVLYLRRSTDKQDQSIDDQRSELRRYAEEHGYEIVGEYLDDAVSGTSIHGRDGFQKMIADAQRPARPFGGILVYDIKRFSRGDVDEAGYYRHLLKQRGVEVVYATESFGGHATDDIVRSVKQFLAQQESMDLSKVTLRGQVSRVRDGWWVGGTPPYGYDLRYFDAHGRPQHTVRFLESGEKQILDNDGHLTRTIGRGERLPKAETDKAKFVFMSNDNYFSRRTTKRMPVG